MIGKIIRAIILIPLVVIIVMFAVANRQVVTVSFDPFDSTNPAFAPKLPLFMLIFILVGLGVLVGGVAAWLNQHKWRARARRAEAELQAIQEAGGNHSALPLAAERPPVILPPAA